MSDHSRWADEVAAYVLGALEPHETAELEAHIAGCEDCRCHVADLRVAADALPVSVTVVSPPAELKDRIMAVVGAEAELLAAAGRSADRPPARPRRRLLDRLSRPAVALASATALLAAGALGGVLLSGGGGGDGARTVVATAEAPGADVRLEIRDDAARLVVEGMPPPPSGRIYQVWLKRPGRDPEPTPVLWSTRSDGSAEVAVPGSLDGIEAVLVTHEPPRGSDEPSVPPVISAPIA